MKPLCDVFRGLYGIAGPLSNGRPEARLGETVALAGSLLRAGVRVLQLRDKASDGRALLETARQLRRMTRETGTLFIVNDRLDIAIMAEADGVHVGQDDLPVDDVRRVARLVGREDLLVGLSTHDLDQVRTAAELEVDYLGFGPIFGTTTKRDALSPRGPALLVEAVKLAAGRPVVGIGGLTLGNLPDVLASGVPMAAVIGDIVEAPDPVQRASLIHQQLLRS
jgi:thiamine-phosphate pyrophosphorylase